MGKQVDMKLAEFWVAGVKMKSYYYASVDVTSGVADVTLAWLKEKSNRWSKFTLFHLLIWKF